MLKKILENIMNEKEQKRLNLIRSLIVNKDYDETVDFIVRYNGGTESIIELIEQAKNIYGSKIYMKLGIEFYNTKPIKDVFDFCISKLSNINTEESFCYLGRLYYKIGNYKNSKYYFKEVVKRNNKNEVANDHLGTIYLKMSESSCTAEKIVDNLTKAQYYADLTESSELLDEINRKIQLYISNWSIE